MRNFIILILLFSFLSCEKEKGFIPEFSKEDVYYHEGKPTELLWKTQVVTGTYSKVLDDIYIVDDMVITYSKFQDLNMYIIKSFHKSDGSLAWELDISEYMDPFSIDEYALKKVGQTIYFIDLERGQFFLIDYASGELKEYRSLEDYDIRPLSNHLGYVHDNNFYSINYEGVEHASFSQYNFVEDQVEKEVDLGDYKIDDNWISNLVYDGSGNTFYLYINDIFYNKSPLISIDLNTSSVTTIWELNDDENHYTSAWTLYLTGDILIFEYDHETLVGVDKNTAQLIWSTRKSQHDWFNYAFSHMDQSILAMDEQLYSIDPGSGKFKWKTRLAIAGDRIDFVPNEKMALTQSRTKDYRQLICIYDLNDGQKLLHWFPIQDLDHEGSLKAVTYDDETKSVLVATSHELLKYKWPLP